MLVFFYGSEYPLNLCLMLGIKYIKTYKAYIKNYCLIFSQFSFHHKCSIVSIYPLQNSITYGFVTDISEPFISILDQMNSKLYNKIDIDVYDENGNELTIKTYIMKNEFIQDYSKPSDDYMKDIYRTISYYWKNINEIEIYGIKNNNIIKYDNWSIFQKNSEELIKKNPF